MCIIVVKPYDEETPSYDTLMNCALSNPDGMGLMWAEEDTVRIVKGCTSVRRLHSIMESVGENRTVVAHFRLATSGKVDTLNCHPYAINAKSVMVHGDELFMEAEGGFVHNGILDGPWTQEELSELSDSALLVRDVVSKLEPGSVALDAALAVLAASSRSKFALIADNNIYRYGNGWAHASTGIICSNYDYLGNFSRHSRHGRSGTVTYYGSGSNQRLLQDDDDWEWDATSGRYRYLPVNDDEEEEKTEEKETGAEASTGDTKPFTLTTPIREEEWMNWIGRDEYDSIFANLCPYCQQPLEGVPGCRWCDRCNLGWDHENTQWELDEFTS